MELESVGKVFLGCKSEMEAHGTALSELLELFSAQVMPK